MIEIKLDAKQLEQSLGKLLANARNPRPIMAGLAQELDNLTKENFANEAWGNQKWQKSKAASEEKRKTLYKTGDLHDLTNPSHSQTYARIGSNLKYAAIHHLGGTIAAKNHPYLMVPVGNGFRKVKKVTIPARPYLPVNKDGNIQQGGEERLLQVAIDALKKGL